MHPRVKLADCKLQMGYVELRRQWLHWLSNLNVLSKPALLETGYHSSHARFSFFHTPRCPRRRSAEKLFYSCCLAASLSLISLLILVMVPAPP